MLENGPLPPAQAVSILRQAAEGLGSAHRAEVVHRDVKPANLMLSDSGEVKILDFGVAWLREANRDRTGSIVLGTPYYMSPEQAMGHPADARSDIYSLGITAFHMLSGRRPFEARSKVDVMLLQAKASLPRAARFLRLRRAPRPHRGEDVRQGSRRPLPALRQPDSDLDALPRALGGRAQ